MLRIHTPTKRHLSQFKTVVVGGGAAGMAVAERINRYWASRYWTCLIEPQEDVLYQPAWTLVGGGKLPYEKSTKKLLGLRSADVYQYQNILTEFRPDENMVEMIDGTEIEYQTLVVAMGLDLKWDQIPGLNLAIEKYAPGICSNYSPFLVEKTWDEIQRVAKLAQKLKDKGDSTEKSKINAIFTQPSTPIKCAGAPQKIAYLAEEYFRKQNVRDQINMEFHTGLPKLFGQPDYEKRLLELMEMKGIKLCRNDDLIAIDYTENKATFKETGDITYDMIHITPPQGPLATCKNSPLADENGWIDVNKHTLQHNKYPNIFALGDCTSTPTSKTAAAAIDQAIVLHQNLTNYVENLESDDFLEMPAKYEGYSSCPIPVGDDKLLLCEFDYDLKRKETFPIDQTVENRFFYWLKLKMFPEIFYRLHVRGYWAGARGMRQILRPFQ